MSKVNIIPMAGLGSRFADAGFKTPKALIPVSGKPMILSAVSHMPDADTWIFIVRQEHIDAYGIDDILTREIPGAIVVPVDETTEGQASTCMLAMPHVSPGDGVFIAACDNAFLYDKARYASLVADDSVDAVVWTFTDDPLLEASPKSWGWVRIAQDGQTVDGMSVKVPISDAPRRDHAVVATFFFRRAQDFIDAYELMRAEDHRVNGEFYVDSLPVFLGRLGKRSVIFDVDLYVGWGKPADLELYERKEREWRAGALEGEGAALWAGFFEKNEEARKGARMRRLKREIPRFAAVGSAAVATDFLIYHGLLLSALGSSLSKGLSFLCGTVVAYLLNKHWTFGKKRKSHREMALFLALYLCTLCINVAANRASLGLWHDVTLAFLVATGISTVLNFVGQKWLVFR